MKLHTAIDQVDISVDAIALPTPMPRHDAKRGVSTSVALLTPATLLKTRDGQCSCMAGSTFPMRARQRLTASYLTRPWSLRLELTSWAGS